MSKIKITLTKGNDTYVNIFFFESEDSEALEYIRNALDTNGSAWTENEYPLIMKPFKDAGIFFKDFTYMFFRSMFDVHVSEGTPTLIECESLIKYIETKDESLVEGIVPYKCRYYNLMVELVKTKFFDNHELEFEICDSPVC